MTPLVIIFSLTFLFNIFSENADGAKILFVNSVKAISHQKPFNLICKELAARGHDVHVIAPIPFTDGSIKNLTVYDISDNVERMAYNMQANLSERQKHLLFQRPDLITTVFLKDPVSYFVYTEWFKLLLEHENVKILLKNNKHFDLVIVEWFFPTMAAFGAYYECPMVGITSLGIQSVLMDAAGNPSHPLLYPDTNLPVKRDMSYFDRITVTIYAIVVRANFYWNFLPLNDKLVKKHFGSHLPYLGDIIKNASLLLMNRHPILSGSVPLLPNIIEIGGIKYPKENVSLDHELKAFLDSATEGLIYFSFGSSFQTFSIRQEAIEAFQDAFRRVPYKVLWKWNDSSIINQPENVMVRTWFPQTAVLDHPNVKLVIFQGGIQSTEEVIAAHKPIIGFPIHSDQVGNIDGCVRFGMGKAMELDTFNAEELLQNILEIIKNDSYVQNAKNLDRLINDQPVDGLGKAIWWIEYVIRNKGTKHLRSKSVDMPLWQYYLLDVVALVVAVPVLVIFSLIFVINRLCRYFRRIESKSKKNE